MASRRSTLVVAICLAACSRQTVSLADRTCGDACVTGYTCNPLTTTCVGTIDVGCDGDGAVCPDTVETGDACSPIGAFLPCPGASADSCDGGCRICGTDNTWSACECVTGETCTCSPSNGGVEICNAVDDDCNAVVDDVVDGASGCIQAWPDNDGDGFGAGEPICQCSVPADYVSNGDDPDDNNGEKCNGADDDGKEGVPDDEIDSDLDGYVTCSGWSGDSTIRSGDCDDHDNSRYPGAPELCDGKANACGASVPEDEVDSDGDGYMNCNDCGPTNPAVHPGADELLLDALDNDCDGKNDECIGDCDCGASSSLVACYELETTTVTDGSNGNTGIVTSTNGDYVVAAKIGNGYSLPSVTAVTASGIDALNVSHFTVMAWIYPNSVPSGGSGGPQQQDSNVYVVDVKQQYSIAIGEGGSFRCAFKNTYGYTRSASVQNAIDTGQWIHVACTYDGDDETLTGYINGVEVASNNVDDAVRTDSSYKLCIGSAGTMSSQDTTCGDNPLNGIIDHVQIFGAARTAKEICLAAGRTDCN